MKISTLVPMALIALTVLSTQTALAVDSKGLTQLIYIDQCDEPTSPDVDGSAKSIDIREIQPSLAADPDTRTSMIYDVQNWGNDTSKYKVTVTHFGGDPLRTQVTLEDEAGNRLAETFLQAAQNSEHAASANLDCDRDPKHLNKLAVTVLQMDKY